MKKQHHFRITVEALGHTPGPSDPANPQLQFDAANHDDVLAIMSRLRQRGDFDADTAAALGLGLKLFGEVALTHRKHPLFAELMPHFGAFIKRLKQGRPADSGPAVE
jgi:hypothetical protein